MLFYQQIKTGSHRSQLSRVEHSDMMHMDNGSYQGDSRRTKPQSNYAIVMLFIWIAIQNWRLFEETGNHQTTPVTFEVEYDGSIEQVVPRRGSTQHLVYVAIAAPSTTVSRYSHAPAMRVLYSHSLAHISSGPSHQPNLPAT